MRGAAWNRNRLTAKLGIEYPIIPGGIFGRSSTIDGGGIEFCGLGSIGALNLSPEAITDVVAEIRSSGSAETVCDEFVGFAGG